MCGDSKAKPASFITAVSDAPVVDEMATLRRILRRIGGILEFIVDSSEETLLGYLKAVSYTHLTLPTILLV